MKARITKALAIMLQQLVISSSMSCWWQKMLAAGDWRRLAHSAKVGLALALVSLTVLLQDAFDWLSPNAIMWTIITTVLVFEYTVGATLSKGLNRALGTVMAASVALFVDYMVSFRGAAFEPYILALVVFGIGMMATYIRFLPTIKERFDYGTVVFLLTFCLVVILGHKKTNNMKVFAERIVAVTMGIIISLIVNISIFPVWAGDDLQNLVTRNFECVASSLEECLKEYFQGVHEACGVSTKICKGQRPFDDKIFNSCRGVLTSDSKEKSLASFANWERRRGSVGSNYQWSALVQLGATLRHCAYTIFALHGCVLSEINQAPPEMTRKVFADACMRVGEEGARLLRGAAADMRDKRTSLPKQVLVLALRHAVEHLHSVIRAFVPHVLCHIRLSSNPNSIANPYYPKPTPSPAPSPNFPLSPPTAASPTSTPDRTFTPLSTPSPTNHFSPSSIFVSDFSSRLNPSTSNAELGQVFPAKGDLEVMSSGMVLHESKAIAGFASVASLVTLLIDVGARVEHVLDANAEFQEQAGFCARHSYDDDEEQKVVNVSVVGMRDCADHGTCK